MQKHTGSADAPERAASQILRPDLKEAARAFFAGIPFVAIGYLDAQGRPGGTLVSGAPGFTWSPDPLLLRVD
ncbi:hypothetical protein [Salinisphaera aquimarina]|uniref:Pyridoxamine 5'-phosphate oxidase putative domain-containing protein n=1 Tax=Salinisphaera aquimarina TaxID=2094031 RepID=A0ABV7ENS8_9GAMM